MAKYIYNCSGQSKTYHAVEIENETYYQIPTNLELEYASNSQLISDLATSLVKMSSNGTSALSGTGSDHVDFLKNSIPPLIKSSNQPFADKVLPNGKKIYTRIHGIAASVQGSPDNVDYTVLYAQAKITGIEIMGAKLGDRANFKVLDDAYGTFSGIPNAVLNQFGFNVYIDPNGYEYISKYDADLYSGMKLRVEYDAIDELLPRDIFVNFILHEVKD